MRGGDNGWGDDASRTVFRYQPQPGRVEGMVLVPRGKLLSWRDVIDVAPSQVQAEITDALATASGQEPDHG
jgi:hypothetical protein